MCVHQFVGAFVERDRFENFVIDMSCRDQMLLAFVIQNHPNRVLADFGRNLFVILLITVPLYLGVRVSSKAGSVRRLPIRNMLKSKPTKNRLSENYGEIGGCPTSLAGYLTFYVMLCQSIAAPPRELLPVNR